MTFTALYRDGQAESNPRGDWIGRLIAELAWVDAEHPGVAVGHQSGWTLSGYPTGLVIWENAKQGSTQRRAYLSRAELRAAFDLVSRGEIGEMVGMLDSVEATVEDRIESLTARMRDLGAEDPEGWARSEIKENIAQQARFLSLRTIWPEIIDSWANEANIRRYAAAARLLDAGADVEDLQTALRAAAYESAFAVLYRIDEGRDPWGPDDAPGWLLIETDPDGKPTGRNVGLLHEDLQTLDPSGRDAKDL